MDKTSSSHDRSSNMDIAGMIQDKSKPKPNQSFVLKNIENQRSTLLQESKRTGKSLALKVSELELMEAKKVKDE